jgi:hypothetical protein
MSNVVDLCIASYSDHLHANILHDSESVIIPSTFEEETCLEVTIVRVHLAGRGDWANPLESIGRAGGSSGVGLEVVGKTENLALWGCEDLKG